MAVVIIAKVFLRGPSGGKVRWGCCHGSPATIYKDELYCMHSKHTHHTKEHDGILLDYLKEIVIASTKDKMTQDRHMIHGST